MKLLIINPGSTSTKLALYDGAKKLLQENLEHDAAALQQYHGIGDQVPMRLAVIRDFLDRSGVHPEELAAVIGRGGLVFGLKTGGYLVNEDLCHAHAPCTAPAPPKRWPPPRCGSGEIVLST